MGRVYERTFDDGVVTLRRTDPVTEESASVSLSADKYGLLLSTHEGEGSFEQHKYNYQFYAYKSILGHISDTFYWTWQTPQQDKKMPRGMGKWVRQNIRDHVNMFLHKHWLDMVANADPAITAVQRRVFAAVGGNRGYTSDFLRLDAFYENTYLVQDIMRYKAAVAAMENYPTFATIADGPHEVGYWRNYRYLSVAEYLAECLPNWMDLFSDTGKAYTSLTRTLMNLPNGVPLSKLRYLPKIHLEAPIYSRLQMLAALQVGEMTTASDDVRAHRLSTVLRSSDDQIRRAVRRVWRYLHMADDFRKPRNIYDAVRFIFDAPDEYLGEGTLVGLADKSLDYHRNGLAAQNNEVIVRLGKDTPTAKPPVALPKPENISLLSTVAQVVQEGELMGHCVAGYAESAVMGQCYLFHIDYQGDLATAEVRNDGTIAQVRGPQNCNNKATEYGKRALRPFSEAIRKHCWENRTVRPQEVARVLNEVAETEDDLIPF